MKKEETERLTADMKWELMEAGRPYGKSILDHQVVLSQLIRDSADIETCLDFLHTQLKAKSLFP